MKSFRDKIIENDIVFTIADKGNTVIAMTEEDYKNKILQFLSPFQKLIN